MLLLAPIWLLALALRGIGRAMGRAPRESRPGRPWEPHVVGAITVVAALGISVSQGLCHALGELRAIQARVDELELIHQPYTAVLDVIVRLRPERAEVRPAGSP